ncbi:MAG: replicative helicase loader/inhibitor [Candidatus Coproplasma sp.]
MTKLKRQDIVTYILKFRLNFENAYPTASDEEFDLLVESWFEILKDYSKEICDQAVNNALKNAKFAPRLGNITEEIENILNADSKSDEELWAELVSSLARVYEISRYLRYSQYSAWANEKLSEIFNSLDEMLKTYLVNISSLVELSELADESLKYEKARFFKQAPNLRKRAIEQKKSQLFLENLQKKALTDGKKK